MFDITFVRIITAILLYAKIAEYSLNTYEIQCVENEFHVFIARKDFEELVNFVNTLVGFQVIYFTILAVIATYIVWKNTEDANPNANGNVPDPNLNLNANGDPDPEEVPPPNLDTEFNDIGKPQR